MQKFSPENSLSLPRNRQKTEMISLSYDINDVHNMFIQIQNPSNFVRI